MDDWGFVKDLVILLAGLFISRFIKFGDSQNSAAVSQAGIGARLAAAERWIESNADIKTFTAELKKDIESLNDGFRRLEKALNSLTEMFGGAHRPAPFRQETPPALSPDIIAGLAMLSRLGKSTH